MNRRNRRLGNLAITFDSVPVYDNWGWADYWECADWMAWHKALVQKYGVSAANDRWMSAWQKNSWDAATNWCRYDPNFVNYMDSQGIETSNIISRLWTSTTNVATNVGTGAETLSNVAKYVVPVGLLIIGGKFVYDYATKK